MFLRTKNEDREKSIPETSSTISECFDVGVTFNIGSEILAAIVISQEAATLVVTRNSQRRLVRFPISSPISSIFRRTNSWPAGYYTERNLPIF